LKNSENSKKGLIFNIERFAVDDGPGIRTLVFFKGCNLHCSWCQNPESQNPQIEIMFHENKCSSCGRCVEVCPRNAVYLSEEFGYLTDTAECDACGLCVKECYYSARETIGRYYSVDELMVEILKDVHFFEESGGGVTFSGGEPLLQAEFLKAVLKECKLHGIRTAIETAGYVAWSKFESIINYIDLVFIDFKHFDNDIHKKETGVSNDLIIGNIYLLNKTGIDVIVRIPVIPEFNFNEETIKEMFLILSEYKNIEHIELLPFHILGKGKYKGLGRSYKFEYTKSLKKQDLEYLKEIGGNMGLNVIVGSI